MNVRTGEITTKETEAAMQKFLDGLHEADRKHMRKMTIPPTPKQMKRKPPKVGRNEPCPCGSGKKFKKCCLWGQGKAV